MADKRVQVEQRVSGVGRARARAWRLVIALAVLIAPVAISDAEAQVSPYASITVAWDANPEPEVTGYFVYVGTSSGVYDERHDVGPRTRFRHAGLTDQEYFFAVAAYSDTATSPLSAEVSAIGNPWFDVTADASGAAGPCSDCMARVFRARGLGAISALTTTRDGRLFFIEDRRHIRIAAAPSAAVLPPALSARDGVEFTGLALASDFERSGHVFVAATRRNTDGTRDITIVRYRDVHNRLGEGAVAVSGLRLWSDRDAPFTVDRLGRIYVAMPLDGRVHGDPHAGYLLWFEANGRVPAEARGGSPILAHGFASPVALDAEGGELWLVGADAAWTRSIARLTPQLHAGGEWPRVPTGIPSGAPAADAAASPAQAFDAHGDGMPGRALVIDTAGRLQPLQTFGFSPAQRLPSIEWPSRERPVAVAIGLNNDVFVAVRQADGTFAIEAIPAR